MENNCLGSCWGHIYSVSQAGSSHGPGTGCGLGAECLTCWTRHCVQARISAGRMGNSPPLMLSASLTGLIYGAASVPDDTAAQQDAVSGASKDLGLPNLAVGVCGPPEVLCDGHTKKLKIADQLNWGSADVNEAA